MRVVQILFSATLFVMKGEGISLPLKILLTVLLNMLLVWLLARFLDKYFQLTGGAAAYVIVGSLLTLMNLFVRPVLDLLTLPLKIFARLLAVIIVNGIFVWITHLIVIQMDPELISFEIFGGLWGWIVIASAFGIGNWLVKELLNREKHV